MFEQNTYKLMVKKEDEGEEKRERLINGQAYQPNHCRRRRRPPALGTGL